MGTKTYDSACYELAKYFLQDEEGLNTEELRKRLASEIQLCVEDEIALMKIERKQRA